jgi:hypothetical protein
MRIETTIKIMRGMSILLILVFVLLLGLEIRNSYKLDNVLMKTDLEKL